MTDTFICAWCKNVVTRKRTNPGGVPRKFCCHQHAKQHHNASDVRKLRAKALPKRNPQSHALLCWCGLPTTLQGIYDYRIFETIPWEICPAGHYTKVERRRIA